MDITSDENSARRFHTRWISEGIGEDYKSWSYSQRPDSINRVFIESSTGTGKTTFILEQLYPYAAKRNRSILYLSNRNALLEQTKYKFEQRPLPTLGDGSSSSQEITAMMYSTPNHQSTITFMNYQAILGFTNSLKSPGPTPNTFDTYNPYYYIILDEAHFFIEDALFNPMTHIIMERVMTCFYNSVFIFMSATMGEIREPILESLKYYTPRTQANITPFAHIIYHNQVFYQNSYHEAQYKLSFFDKYNEIIAMVKESPSNERWLIFVSSKLEGQRLRQNIKAVTGCTVAFLSAGKKGNKQWETLIEHSNFKENVLIATTVLDNGTNITDPSVKHIVLPFCDRTSFLQMLGRRRTAGNETLQIYARSPTIQTLNSQLRLIKKLSNAMRPFLYYPNQDRKVSYADMTRLLQSYWLRGDQSINNLFCIDYKRNLVLNWLACKKVFYLAQYYSNLKKHSADPLYYQHIVQSWLGMDTEDTIDDCSLVIFMTTRLNQPIPESAQEQFYQEFQRLYKLYCYTEFKDDEIKYKQALSIRKGRTQRKATINRSLKLLGLPYQIAKRDNCWILEEHKPNDFH